MPFPTPRPPGLPRRAMPLLLLLLAPPGARAAASAELTELSLEQLMDVEIVSASAHAQRLAEAPAAVTVIRAADIRQFGHRTLADVLRGVRGFHFAYDRVYEYAGTRGFAPPGDYNTRLLVLLDGRRVNDDVYDSGPLGGEFPLDLALVDRIEIVRGPGSSVYGGNAMFGVINVITRPARDLDGTETQLAAGSHGERSVRASWGREFESGLSALVSATGYTADGGRPYFPEFAAAPGGGIARGTDFEHRSQFHAKFDYGPWQLSATGGRRDKGNPSGAWATDFNDPQNRLIDTYSTLALGFDDGSPRTVATSLRLSLSDYRFQGDYRYAGTTNRDTSRGNWWGLELRQIAKRGAHTFAWGGELRRSMRQDQANFDLGAPAPILDHRHSSTRHGLGVQDDVELGGRWTLSAGLRWDGASDGSGAASPRLGLIHADAAGGTWKLLHGAAYRLPSVYERFYALTTQQAGNPDLRPERIRSLEAIWERQWDGGLRLLASAYQYRLHDWIVQQARPSDGLWQFTNLAPVSARGVELEAERRWPNGALARASYAAQFAPQPGGGVLNPAPRHLMKTALAWPLPSPGWSLGGELQYAGSRPTASGRVTPAAVVNGTLLYRPAPRAASLALSVYNLTGRNYADPMPDPGVPTREVIVQDGLAWRLAATIPF